MWGWLQFIYELSGGDILKQEKILKLNHRDVLNWICYTISKHNYQESLNKHKT